MRPVVSLVLLIQPCVLFAPGIPDTLGRVVNSFSRTRHLSIGLVFAAACGSATLRPDGGTGGNAGSDAGGTGGAAGSGASGTGGTAGSGAGGTGGTVPPTGCTIGGTTYASGATNPGNPCQSCNPSISTSAWYQVPSDCATLAAYNYVTCATVSGVAKCWGANGSGRGRGPSLGVGQSYDQIPYSGVPVALSALGTGVQAVSTGPDSFHACAVVNGGVKCWGDNGAGQLGDATTFPSNAPVQVLGLTSGVQGVATGDSHSCALVNGQVQCWGDNSSGQLGISGSPTIPVTALVNGNVQAIAFGAFHSCALVSGSLSCWGSNSNGQLGSNSTMPSSYSPMQVTGLGSNVQAIAAGGAHTCAIANGSLLCWGANSGGQVGDGTKMDRSAPVPVQGLSSGVQAVAAGAGHTCAVVNGGAYCWGGNVAGQLGDNSMTERLTPVLVQGLSSGVQAITAGGSHSCALTSSGTKCWGSNQNGELGDNSTTPSPIPVAVQGL